jgi:hypothetical protein
MLDNQSSENMNEVKTIYDVFIGYHGTFDDSGSYKSAKVIANFLKDLGYEVYLHGYLWSNKYPSHKDTEWTATWERINESKTFLLVINDCVPKKGNGALGNDSDRVSQLRDELDTFNTLVQARKRNKHDFNWFYVGEIEDIAKQQAFLYNLYNPLTNGHNSLIYGIPDYDQIKNWLISRFSIDDYHKLNIHESSFQSNFQENDLTVVSAESFLDAYHKACYFSKGKSYNLLVRIALTTDDFAKKFPFEDALKKSKILMEKTPEDDDLINRQFSLYHGDYIILQNNGSRINGYEHVINELKQKHTSRRALISLISTEHIVNSGDSPIPSYMLSQFQISNDTLYVTEYFRAMEVQNFYPINLGETYLFVNNLIHSLPNIKKIMLLYHIFEAYISNYPVLCLYIPLMDRPNADLEIIPAIKAKDSVKLIELLEDKEYSKVFNLHVGFDLMIRSIKKFKSYGEELLITLSGLSEKCRKLEELYSKSNEPQALLVDQIDDCIKYLIKQLRG